MIQLRWLQINGLRNKLLMAGILSLSLVGTANALAQYVPQPGSDRPSGAAGGGGTRGICENAQVPALTALAPFNHTGKTTVTHPTVAWFVPDGKSYQMEFRLYEQGLKGEYKLLQTTRPQSAQGIMKLSLPKQTAGLAQGQTYRWQLTLLCKPNDPSKDIVIESTIALAAMPPDLEAALSKTSDRRKRANLYAQAGFWYDALAETLEPDGKASRISLVEDLIQLETPSSGDKVCSQADPLKRDGVCRQIENLKQVVARERRAN